MTSQAAIPFGMFAIRPVTSCLKATVLPWCGLLNSAAGAGGGEDVGGGGGVLVVLDGEDRLGELTVGPEVELLPHEEASANTGPTAKPVSNSVALHRLSLCLLFMAFLSWLLFAASRWEAAPR